MVKNVVSFYSGYIQVHKAGYWNEQTLDNSFSSNEKLESAVLKTPHVTGVSPRLESFALASCKELTKGCLITMKSVLVQMEGEFSIVLTIC